MTSPIARAELRRGGMSRAWQRFLDAMQNVEQPNNDRYVFLLCLWLFGAICGYALAVKQQELRAQADQRPPITKEK